MLDKCWMNFGMMLDLLKIVYLHCPASFSSNMGSSICSFFNVFQKMFRMSMEDFEIVSLALTRRYSFDDER